MIKTKLILTALLSIITVQLIAQDAKAKQILDELSDKTRKYTTITSDFDFTLDDKAADVHQTQEGLLKMKGSRYYIKLGENHIYSDGETRWTYNEDMQEVYIDHAESGDDALNPTEIYTVWESGFKHYYDKEITENGKTYHVIKLNPTDPEEKPFHTVKLYVDKAKMEVAKIEILGKQGDDYIYSVNSFKPDISYDAGTFKFDMAENPGVVVIDNR